MSPFFFWSVVCFVLGLITGSFLNVCVYRMPRGLSIITPPSHCPECNSRILWYDNIPVVSYLFLKGKCRRCGRPISPLYLVVEVLTALLFLSAYLFSDTLPEIMFRIVLFSILVLASFIDIKYFVIPDESNLIGFIFAVLMSALFPYLQGCDMWYMALADSLLGAFTGFLTLGFVSFAGSRLLKKDAMGFGDVKFIAMIGAFAGWQLVLLTIMTASLIGAVLGGTLMLFKNRNLKGRIPFGPYLAAGTVISVLFGKAIIGWYFSFCGI